MKQYHSFAATLYACVTQPENSSHLINHYLSKDYYPVGFFSTEKPNQAMQSLAWAL